MSLLMEIVACGLSCFILFLNLLCFIYDKFRHKKVSLHPAENIVVITGCDSGFGEMTSRALARLGYKVISGCLTDDGIQRLNGVVSVAVSLISEIICRFCVLCILSSNCNFVVSCVCEGCCGHQM